MSFSKSMILEVWKRGTIVEGCDPDECRKDTYGAWMKRDHYGDRDSGYGWEIDHILPVSKGGSDNLSNLRPLQWENNAARQNGELECRVFALGEENIKLNLE